MPKNVQSKLWRIYSIDNFTLRTCIVCTEISTSKDIIFHDASPWGRGGAVGECREWNNAALMFLLENKKAQCNYEHLSNKWMNFFHLRLFSPEPNPCPKEGSCKVCFICLRTESNNNRPSMTQVTLRSQEIQSTMF